MLYYQELYILYCPDRFIMYCQVVSRLLAVETEGAASLHRSLEKREVGRCHYTATSLDSTLSYSFVLYLFILYHGLIHNQCLIVPGITCINLYVENGKENVSPK